MRPTADWRCLASGRAATQACVCRLWAVACVASRSGPVTRAHKRWHRRTAGLTAGLRHSWRCAIQIDSLYLLPLTYKLYKAEDTMRQAYKPQDRTVWWHVETHTAHYHRPDDRLQTTHIPSINQSVNQIKSNSIPCHPIQFINLHSR